MSTAEIGELADVLDRVKRWSVAGRFALVKEVLETLAPEAPTTPSTALRGRPLEEILESFQSEGPAPGDETVRRWIDEQRMEKYG